MGNGLLAGKKLIVYCKLLTGRNRSPHRSEQGLCYSPCAMTTHSQAPKILLVVTGSVAAIKAAELTQALQALGEVRVVLTRSAAHFCPVDLPATCYRDDDEWLLWRNRGDPVLHIALRNWADILVIAPVSAHCLAGLATGAANSLALCVARAWDRSKPCLIAPAMNTHMWNHPITSTQLNLVVQWGATVIAPIEKKLACGDVGMGAMAETGHVCAAVQASLGMRRPAQQSDGESLVFVDDLLALRRRPQLPDHAPMSMSVRLGMWGGAILTLSTLVVFLRHWKVASKQSC